MTENEAIDKLNNLHYKIVHTSFRSMVYESEIEALCMAKDCLKEIQQYRAIGTIEEFKELKDYKELYDVYRNIGSINEFRNLKNKKNVLPIANITIDEEDMQKIVDEKIKEIELDIQEIRAKAIDDFVKTICKKYTEEESKGNYKQFCANIKQELADIAEQMKGGGKDA